VAALRRLAALGAITAAVAAAPATAAETSCGDAVLEDWHENGRIDGLYAPRCYRAAVAGLPEDVRVYSSAQDDIGRAIQARLETSARARAADDTSGPSGFRLPLLVVGTVALLMLTGGLAADAVGRR
jgi:uncharacterized protein (DUF3084 family)